MLSIIQRVSHADVLINKQITGSIQQGIVALLGIEKTDTQTEAKRLIERILNYRIFDDHQGKMNLSLRDIQGGLLLIPQFTLAANTDKGNRPSFSCSAEPSIAQPVFKFAVQHAQQQHPFIAAGQFAADMQLSLCNDGPVTFTLKTSPPKK